MTLSSVSVWIQAATLSILTALLCRCASGLGRNSHLASLIFNVTHKLLAISVLASL
jgi:hypothetical protein